MKKIIKSPHFYYVVAITGLLLLFLLKNNSTGVNREIKANQLMIIKSLRQENEKIKKANDWLVKEKDKWLKKADSLQNIAQKIETKIVYINEKIDKVAHRPIHADSTDEQFFANYQ